MRKRFITPWRRGGSSLHKKRIEMLAGKFEKGTYLDAASHMKITYTMTFIVV